jgi:type IX secretion system PorP/SprF family membrane protein
MRTAAIILLMGLAVTARAQQLTQYTQYVFNHFSVNPAVAGSKDCLDVRLGYRQQWVGFEGAPTTGWASIHGTIRPKARGFQANKHGVGAFIEADEAGNWGYTRFLLAYAYHIQMSRDYYLAMGAFAGAQQMKFDLGEARPNQLDDPALDGTAAVMVIPDITPGVWFYSRTAWGGIALHNAKLSRHFMLSAGYRNKVGRKMSFSPSALVRKAAGAPIALDVNAMLEWNRTVGIGVGYRNGDAFTAMVKVGFLEYFQLGYSYDITMSRIRLSSSNTHEIILAITPCGKEDASKRMISCPAFD